MSTQIRLEWAEYYAILERTQKGRLDITGWLDWFFRCLDRAFDGTGEVLSHVLHKARFWEAVAGEIFSERQRAVINRLLDGFEGKLTSSKWAKLTRSPPTRRCATLWTWLIGECWRKRRVAAAAQATGWWSKAWEKVECCLS